MKITIWGSGGGEGYPALFCNCDHCKSARAKGGKSIRSLSQTLVNDDLIIDLPADTLSHLQKYSASLGSIENVLITHSHCDHFYPTMFLFRGGGFAKGLVSESFNIFGSDKVKECFLSEDKVFPIGDINKSKIVFPKFNVYEQFKVGKYFVTALPANHAPQLNSLNYVVSDGKTAMLYFLDTGYPCKEVLDYLETYKTPIKCVIMDATMGVAPFGTYRYHMGFAEIIALKKELIERKIAKQAIFVASHITHNNAGLHEEIQEQLSSYDIVVAFDGYSIEF